ncbi:uncharacterized protein LOC142231542 isoform X1 [Haematobia irritans]|uniref:uncharacterized protein LOC142231542 isoform X1 n=1 Tax=Haematobia irritans TaxID=7368 RepID=UPI003F50CF41
MVGSLSLLQFLVSYAYHKPNTKTPVYQQTPPSPPKRSKFVSSCMNSHRRYLSHRTSKFSSNRHRKLQPFRET